MSNNTTNANGTNGDSPNINGASSTSNGNLKLNPSTEVDQLYEEARRGVKESATIVKFIEKKAQIDEAYGKALLKLCKEYPFASTGSGIGEIFSGLLEFTAKQAGSLLSTTSQLTNDIVTPLGQFVIDLKSELKVSHPEAQKLEVEKRDVLDSYKKSKSSYESACTATFGFDQVDELEEEYKARVQHTNAYLQGQHMEKFNKMAFELQKTETLRIHKTKKGLQKYRDLFSVPEQTLAEWRELSDKLDGLDSKKEIQNFTSLAKNLSSEEELIFEPLGRKNKIRFSMAMLGKSNNQQASEKGGKEERKNSQPTPPSSAVFGVPLEALMAKQKIKHPDLNVPHIVLVLLDLIKQLNGCKTEGIFRIPGVMDDMKFLKRTFDEGGPVDANTFPNVFTAASALKMWFRELPNSIIPEDMYYSCLGCEAVEEALLCFDQFPELNKRILLIMMNFFKELLQEEKLTKMNAENISIVFTPSFMRCSTLPSTSLVHNVEREKQFVHFLIMSCDQILAKYTNLLETHSSPTKESPREAREGGGGGWKNVRPNHPSSPGLLARQGTYPNRENSARPQLSSPMARNPSAHSIVPR